MACPSLSPVIPSTPPVDAPHCLLRRPRRRTGFQPHAPNDPPLGVAPTGNGPAGVGTQPGEGTLGESSPPFNPAADGPSGDTGVAASPDAGGFGGMAKVV